MPKDNLIFLLNPKPTPFKRGSKFVSACSCPNSACSHRYAGNPSYMVRAGKAAVYGLYPSDEVDKNQISLKPAMEMKEDHFI